MNVKFNSALQLLTLLVATWVANRTDAQPPKLEWTASAGCPDAARVQKRLDAGLRDGRRAVRSPLAVRAMVSREADHFALELSLRKDDVAVQRELIAPTCDELVEALVWLVVIGADRGASDASASVPADATSAVGANDGADAVAPVAAAPESPAVPVAPAKDDTSIDPHARPEQQPATTRDDPIATASARASVRSTWARWFRAALGSGMWAFELPKPQAQLAAGAGIGIGPLFFELRYAHLFAGTVGFGGERHVSVRSESLSVLGCALFPVSARVRLGPCAELTGMRSVALARGITNPGHGSDLWLLGSATAQAGVMLRAPLELVAEVGLGVPLGPRPSFSVTGHGEVARAAQMAEQASLAIAAHW